MYNYHIRALHKDSLNGFFSKFSTNDERKMWEKIPLKRSRRQVEGSKGKKIIIMQQHELLYLVFSFTGFWKIYRPIQYSHLSVHFHIYVASNGRTLHGQDSPKFKVLNIFFKILELHGKDKFQLYFYRNWSVEGAASTLNPWRTQTS